MCGRYGMFLEDNPTLERIAGQAQKNSPNLEFRAGEVFPTNTVPVIIERDGQPTPYLFQWGFPNFQKKGVIINARSETANEKKMFQKSLESRRCIVPSSGFYEWKQDETKQKYLFQLPNTNILYMAGLYNEFDGIPRFVILTTQANASIADIHNRMPVVLTEDCISKWLLDTVSAHLILKSESPFLNKVRV